MCKKTCTIKPCTLIHTTSKPSCVNCTENTPIPHFMKTRRKWCNADKEPFTRWVFENSNDTMQKGKGYVSPLPKQANDMRKQQTFGKADSKAELKLERNSNRLVICNLQLRWVRIELTTLGLWDLRAANCAITAWIIWSLWPVFIFLEKGPIWALRSCPNSASLTYSWSSNAPPAVLQTWTCAWTNSACWVGWPRICAIGFCVLFKIDLWHAMVGILNPSLWKFFCCACFRFVCVSYMHAFEHECMFLLSYRCGVCTWCLLVFAFTYF